MGTAFINDKDEIYVPDPYQFRVTKFDRNGQVLHTFNTSQEQDINFFIEVHSYEDDKFLAFYYKEVPGKYAKHSRKGLFHIWSSDFQKEIAAYGKFERLGFTEDSYGRRSIRSMVGSIAKTDNGDLFLAPFLYEGNIIHYQKKANEGWEYHRSIAGYQSTQPAWVSLSENDPEAGTIHSSGMEPVYGEKNILSSGIFTLNADREYIIHFSIRRDSEAENEEWTFGAEMFDNNYKYISYFPLDTLYDFNMSHKPLVQWKDNRGQFYMLDEEQGVPVVRVFSLDIREK